MKEKAEEKGPEGPGRGGCLAALGVIAVAYMLIWEPPLFTLLRWLGWWKE